MIRPADVLYLVLAIVVAPFFYLKRKLKRKPLAPLRPRLGGFPKNVATAPVLWLHGVSVGEIKAARGLVEILERENPGLAVWLSVTTKAGMDVAKKDYPGRTVFYAPLDFSWVVAEAFDRVRPLALILMETELWPNLLAEARRRRVPVIVANAKMSERSARGYRRLRFFAPRFLDGVRLFCLQHDSYLPTLASVGVGSERLVVTGVIKVDNLPSAVDPAPGRRLREALGLADDQVLWVAGSTHPGEEAAVFEAFIGLRKDFPNLRLAIAPRHTNRADAVAKAAAGRGIDLARRSQRQGLHDHEGLLVDTMGELEGFFAAADLVFLGGSLVPVGGHNILEPAAWKKPVIFGPHTWTVGFFAEEMLRLGAARRVESAAALKDVAAAWISDPKAREAAGAAARAMVDRHRGATRRTVQAVYEVLAAAGRPFAQPARRGEATKATEK